MTSLSEVGVRAAIDNSQKPARASQRPQAISDRFVASALRRLREGKPLRRRFQPWGRVNIERQLPFLVVYRKHSRRDDPNTFRLVIGEASYLLAPGDRKNHRSVSELVRGIAATFTEEFGAFLLVEVWAGLDDDGASESNGLSDKTGLTILRPKGCRLHSTVDVLD